MSSPDSRSADSPTKRTATDLQPSSARHILHLGLAVGLCSLAYTAAACRTAEPLGGTPVDPIASTEYFAFYSNPVLNLHHFLYRWAAADGETSQGIFDAGMLSDAEAQAWNPALNVYRSTLVERSLLFDGNMVELKQALRGLDPEDPGAFDDLPLTVGPVLEAALPVYRTHWWSDHDRSNRAWIEAAVPALRTVEHAFAERLVEAYDGSWPDGPIPVDVSAVANWAGAYTTNGPTHIVISSTDAGNQGGLAVENTFHEASHAGSLGGAVRAELRAAFTERSAEAPDRFWHAVIFYSTGETARTLLPELGVEDYVPYAERFGLYERTDEWTAFRRVLDEAWAPFLKGGRDRASAFEQMVDALASRP